MSNLLAEGERWLADMQTQFASTEIRYERLPSSVVLSAVIGRSSWDVEDAQGGMLRLETRDFIVTVVDLKLDDIPVEPAPGDRITEDDHIYEVQPAGPGLPHWRWAEPDRLRYRIHTKFVGRVP